ncbi:MAG: cyclic nucleotide-binding domain-containing protein [Anaerolineae bacterium]
MVSPELIRRYPFFAGLDHDQIELLARNAQEVSVEEGHRFFREGDELERFYLMIKGAADIVMEVPDRDKASKDISGQLTGEMATNDVTVSSVGSGDVFGWSGLIPPHTASAGAIARTPSRVAEFDSHALNDAFAEDRLLGFVLTQRAANVMRERLRDIRIESLSQNI